MWILGPIKSPYICPERFRSTHDDLSDLFDAHIIGSIKPNQIKSNQVNLNHLAKDTPLVDASLSVERHLQRPSQRRPLSLRVHQHQHRGHQIAAVPPNGPLEGTGRLSIVAHIAEVARVGVCRYSSGATLCSHTLASAWGSAESRAPRRRGGEVV